MEKIWFTFIDGVREGPWSLDDLKCDIRVDPDTLVWKEGFPGWKKIRDVPELEEALFEEETVGEDTEEEQDEGIEFSKKPMEDELVLDMRSPPPYFFWIVIALLALVYAIVQLYALIS